MKNHFIFTPVRLTVLSFVALIFFGALLLILPYSTAGLASASFVDALFTATSAVCVTGLTVQDTATFFSTFGQCVILILIQLGGLGIMTLYAALPLIFGQRLRLSQRVMFFDIFAAEHVTDLLDIVKSIIKYTFLVEMIGAVILTFRFYHYFGNFTKSLYYGVFHSVSAFCNAGFALFSNNFIDFRGDYIINFTIMGLVILGGLGFIVIHQISQKKNWKNLSSNSKLVIFMTGLFIFVPSFFVFHLEFAQGFAGMPIGEKIMASLFHVVVTRTAGFNTVDMTVFGNATVFIFCILMFIGASPGGTGGGIKTTTFGLMTLSVKAIFRGQNDIECFGRRVPQEIITKSIAIISVGFFVVTSFVILLMIIEPAAFRDIFFEVISAFGTVGLSLGLTPQLSVTGKILLSFVMLIGRVGTLTLIFILGTEQKTQNYKFPDGKFMVG